MTRWIALLLTAMLVVTACREDEPDPAPSATPGSNPSPSSPASPSPASSAAGAAELLDQFAAAMERDGQVFHTTITTTSTAGDAVPEQAGETAGLWTEEIWVAPDDDAARKIFREDPANNSADRADEAEVLLVDGALYHEDDDEIEDEEWRAFCPPGDPERLVAFVLEISCESFGPGSDEDDEGQAIDSRVDPDASFDGKPATAIVYEVVVQPEGQPSPTPFGQDTGTPRPNINAQRMEARLYLDPATSLPLAWETKVWDHAGSLIVTLLADFENDFIPREEFEAGFFDPGAFGYVAEDPLAPLDDPNLDVTVYWLGERFEPGGGLPAVEIYEVLGLRPPGGGPGDQIMIEYDAVDVDATTFGFRLQLWTREDWESQGSQFATGLWPNYCVDTEVTAVEGGTAVIYQTHEPASDGRQPDPDEPCPDSDYDRFVAVVDYGDTIATINLPLTQPPNSREGSATDPFDTLAGMRAIVEGLHPRNGEAQESPPATGDPPSMVEVYAGLAATLADAGEGKVLHITESTTGEIPDFIETEVTTQTWVDVSVPVARTESQGRWEYIEGEYIEEGKVMESVNRSIILGTSTYRTSEGDFEPNEPSAVDAEGCYGQPEAIATVIGCPGPTETSETTVEWGEHDGELTIVLVTEGTTRGSDEVHKFVGRLYLDPESYLPLYGESSGISYAAFPTAVVMQVEHEFVERSSLSKNFFEPSAIGYTEPDPAARIDEFFDTPVYWLGEQFEPEGGPPALTLWGAQGSPEPSLHYDGYLHYTLTDNPHGAPVVSLELWSASDWEAGRAVIVNSAEARPCSGQETLPASEGVMATLYHWVDQEFGPPASVPEDADCQTPGPTRYMAIIEFPETVVVVDAPGSSSPRDGYQPSPYNTPTGMRAIVDGLERR